MTTYIFKTEEEADDNKRIIVKTQPVPASETTKEFTLEQKETELKGAEEGLVSAQNRVDDLIKEIKDIKTALEIT